MYGRVQPIFPGLTVFVIGSGPSLSEVDLEDLRGFPTIVVNKSYEAAPWADILYFSDRRFYMWYTDAIHTFRGQKFTAVTEKRLNHPAITNLRKYKMRGLATDAGYVCTGNNSGYAAINVAYHAGASRIILLGFDLKSDNGRHHWHSNHPVHFSVSETLSEEEKAEIWNQRQEKVYRKMVPHFETLVEPLTATGVEVLNTSMDSALTCFPKIPLKQIMDETWFREGAQLLEAAPT